MATIKCRMCGKDIPLTGSRSWGKCEFCGGEMTFPTTMDPARLEKFDRAGELRRQNAFDLAINAYDELLDEDENDAEAHWGALLSWYGIEYVEDPVTHAWIPTCHRAQLGSILTDEDYRAALENAPDAAARALYEHEAQRIAELQKGILAISEKEPPYDVFICYKEQDERGDRTVDSTLAQDIYYQLTGQGYRVFFARITLEDKLGQEYEPYIFAALRSARVMLVVGTKPERFCATWVRNEWSRFLSLMKDDRSRLLIPCYRDMDPYDLPKELSGLQSQDMGRIGFIQDVIRGVRKILDAGKPKVEKPAEPPTLSPGVESLLVRAQLFLEDGEWDSADEYAERVLDLAPKCAAAYIVKVQAARRVSTEAELANCGAPLSGDRSFEKALRFSDAEQKKRYEGYRQAADERLKQRETDEREERERQERLETERRQREEQERREAEERERLEAERRQREEQTRREREERERQERQEAERRQREEQTRREDSGGKVAVAALGDGRRDGTASEAIMAVAAGNYHTVGLRADGTVLAIGRNDNGQCKVADWRDIVAVAAGGSHTVGVKADGTALAVGRNDNGQCDVRAWTDLVAVAAGDKHTVGLRRDGTVLAAGCPKDNRCNVSGWTGIVAVAAGEKHTVGLKWDGTVVAVGTNWFGRCDVSGWTDIVAIAAGMSHTIGVKSNGKVVAVGGNGDGQCDVADWRDVVAVASGMAHTVGLTSDGTVVSTGSKVYGRREVSDWTGIAAVAAGYYHTVGLKSDGTVLAVGDYVRGQINVSDWNLLPPADAGRGEPENKSDDAAAKPKDASPRGTEPSVNGGKVAVVVEGDGRRGGTARKNTMAVSAGGYHTVGLRSNGTVLAVGKNDRGQCNVSDWTDIVAVSAGYEHTVGLKSDGTVLAVGSNSYGELNVSDWRDIVAVVAGTFCTVGLKPNGTAVAVGYNKFGLLAGASLRDIVSRTAGGAKKKGQCDVSDWTGIVAVAAGNDHTVGLRSDGTVLTAGPNAAGRCDVSDWRDIAAVSAGYQHTVGLRSDNTVITVGKNDMRQRDVSEWRDIVAVAAGGWHTVGLKSDGTVLAAGLGDECDVSDWTDIVAVSAGRLYTVGLRSDGTVLAVGNNDCHQLDVSDWNLLN